jgi:hypothetical protein
MKFKKNGHSNGKHSRVGKRLRLPGLPPIKVVSQEEAEQSDMVICCPIGSPRYFDDDVETTCAECGTGIFHRPHVPKRPKKVCLDCAVKLLPERPDAPGTEGGAGDGDGH